MLLTIPLVISILGLAAQLNQAIPVHRHKHSRWINSFASNQVPLLDGTVITTDTMSRNTATYSGDSQCIEWTAPYSKPPLMSLLCDHDIPDLINEHPDARAFSFQELLDYLDGKNDDADEMSTETPALTMEARNDEPLRELRNTEDWFRWLDGEEEGGSQSASGSATIPEVEPEAVLAEREDTAIDRLQDEVAAATQEYNDKLWLVMSLGEDW